MNTHPDTNAAGPETESEQPFVSPFNPVEKRVFTCPFCCSGPGQAHGEGCDELIQAVEVKRDQDGWWHHPGIPDLDEDVTAWAAWKVEQGIETRYSSLEYEAEDHPAYHAYFTAESGNVTGWNPAPPGGEGWFALSIHDTEDGPVWVWARRVEGGM